MQTRSAIIIRANPPPDFVVSGSIMTRLSACLLTFDSARLLRECLEGLKQVADEIVVVDSGSTDATLDILAENGLTATYRAYKTHGDQMNHATALAANDWVLCMDSDEVLDAQTINRINTLKADLEDPAIAYRITRQWYVLGRPVRALYPVSSPDNPVRLFHRAHSRFNDAPVDDKPIGHARSVIIPGNVRHDTFHTVHEVFNKVNGYTTRLTAYRPAAPSLTRAVVSGATAFFKWYLVKGGWRDGRVGLLAGIYASLYSFLKYFKPWVERALRKSS